MTRPIIVAAACVLLVVGLDTKESFDHRYTHYADLLRRHVTASGVDYQALKADRARLDGVAGEFAGTGDINVWSRAQQMAFWINAYNLFTLRAIVDHYPIQAGWFTRQPRNSIRQIDGVWTDLQWRAAGRAVTLDDIEHRILRPVYKDARIHFAVNCASVSCPPLAAEPFRAETLEVQLDAAARRYLASSEGARLDGETIRVSRLFDWYGDDFIADYAPLVKSERVSKERAILGTLVKYAPPSVAARAQDSQLRVTFIPYNWALNEVRR